MKKKNCACNKRNRSDAGTAPEIDRREFLRRAAAGGAAITLGAIAGGGSLKADRHDKVWQIDPDRCIQCGRCATACVLAHSAVRCLHAYRVCGYCELCFGYFRPGVTRLDTAAENQACPTGALQRRFIEEPYYEYSIDRDRCIGCGICVKGCHAFGNGSLYLQICQDICVQCNECAISRVCPSNAIHLIPAKPGYLSPGDQSAHPPGGMDT